MLRIVQSALWGHHHLFTWVLGQTALGALDRRRICERLDMHRLIFALTFSTALCAAPFVLAQETPALDTTESQVSYGIGLQIGQNIAQQGFDGLDIEALTQAIRDVLDGTEPRLDTAALQAAFAAFQQDRDAAKIAEGQAFLEENGKRDGIVTTNTGLQYMIIEEGSGESPTREQTVTVHYTGRLLNGTVFDSSQQRGQPASFPVGGVIPGWTEALMLMKPGATWEVWLPSEIAYGTRGAGGDIGPNEVLNFTIELISVDG